MTIKDVEDYLTNNADDLEPKKTFTAMYYVLEKATSKERFLLRHSCYVLCKVCEILYQYRDNVAKTWTAMHVLRFFQKYRKYMMDSMNMYQNANNPIRLFYNFLKTTYQADMLKNFYRVLDPAADSGIEYEVAAPVQELDWTNPSDNLTW